MATPKVRGYPVLIIGAGRGGAALLEMFLEDSLVKVIAVADTDPRLPASSWQKITKFQLTPIRSRH